MKTLKKLSISAIVLILLFVPTRKTFSKEICVDGFLQNSSCPCPDKNGDGEADPEYSSLCGVVRSSNIEPEKSAYYEDQTNSSYGNVVGGATIGIYECNDNYPSCFPYGNLGGDDPADRRKVGECISSEKEGKFHCYAPRVSPNSRVYVVVTCGSGKPYIEEVPSNKSIVDLPIEVDCSGVYNGEEQPDTIEIADRSAELSCTIDESAPKVGVEADSGVKEVTSFSANIGVEGGDIRYTRFEPMPGIMGFHPGAYWGEDCMVMYDKDRAKGVDGDKLLNAQWGILGGVFSKYDSVEQKCNPTRDLELIAPFMYGIPKDSKMTAQRTFEGRFAVSNEMENPVSIQQYNSVTYSNCASKVVQRLRGEDYEEDPIPCEEILSCKNSYGGNKNMYTTASWAAKGGDTSEIQDMIDNKERDQNDIYCRDETLGDITFGQVQPMHPDDNCTPGGEGCRYLLPNIYLLPDVLPKGGITEDRGTATINDTYGTTYRADTWDVRETAAESPHKVGHTSIYADDSPGKNNSGVTALRIATDEINPDVDDHGVIANRYVNPVDAADRNYNYNPDVYVRTIGSDAKTQCALSSVNGAGDKTVTPETEESFLTHFNFVGLSNDLKSNVGGTYTYATPDSMERDKLLNSGGVSTILLDYFDTLMRIAIDDEGKFDEAKLRDAPALFGEYSFFNFIKNYGGDNIRKSFAERIAAASWDYDKDSIVNTTYCISDANFKSHFPAYGEAGYPGNDGQAEACYPWQFLNKGEYCNVYPGPSNPNIEGNLRTCKLTRCVKRWDFETVCDDQECEYGEVDPITGVFNCITYSGGTGCYEKPIPIPCSENDIRTCLINQEDTYPAAPVRGNGPYCDLWRAGPMKMDGDIMKDHAARAVQEPLYPKLKQQVSMDPIADTANYMAQTLTPATKDSTYFQDVKVIDY